MVDYRNFYFLISTLYSLLPNAPNYTPTKFDERISQNKIERVFWGRSTHRIARIEVDCNSSIDFWTGYPEIKAAGMLNLLIDILSS